MSILIINNNKKIKLTDIPPETGFGGGPSGIGISSSLSSCSSSFDTPGGGPSGMAMSSSSPSSSSVRA
jgi:hypothetical protein